jgi:hypothetical protein
MSEICETCGQDYNACHDRDDALQRLAAAENRIRELEASRDAALAKFMEYED